MCESTDGWLVAWDACACSFFHAVASPFHYFVTTCEPVALLWGVVSDCVVCALFMRLFLGESSTDVMTRETASPSPCRRPSMPFHRLNPA